MKTKIERFIYASSSWIYKAADKPLKEDVPILSHTPYGISKLAGEYYCWFYSKKYGLPVTILRYFNSYGSREKDNHCREVISRFIKNSLENLPLLITGSGSEKRDFTYVEATVKGTVLIVLSLKEINEVFNISTGKATTIAELAQMVSCIMGNQDSIKYLEMRNWDQTIVRTADIEKAKTLLGYNPQYDLAKELNVTIKWYQKNRKYVKEGG